MVLFSYLDCRYHNLIILINAGLIIKQVIRKFNNCILVQYQLFISLLTYSMLFFYNKSSYQYDYMNVTRITQTCQVSERS